MPRVIKHPDVRKAELIKTAQSLFCERGYDGTSVDEIIKRAGVSKGAFYYYFASKEALLEAHAEQVAQQAASQAEDITRDKTLSAVEKLNLLTRHGQQMKLSDAKQTLSGFEALFRPENVALYHRTHLAVSRAVLPLVTSIIAQGVEENAFRSAEPALTAEIVLNLMTATHGAVESLFRAQTEEAFKQAVTDFNRRFVEQGIAIDRILGLPDGSVKLVEQDLAEALFAGWQGPGSQAG